MKGIIMRPYIHLIYELNHGMPGKQIATITGKSNFKKWVMKRYFEESGGPVCFNLEGDAPFYEVLPFVYMKGKNKGKDRVVYARLGAMTEDTGSEIPF